MNKSADEFMKEALRIGKWADRHYKKAWKGFKKSDQCTCPECRIVRSIGEAYRKWAKSKAKES